MRTLPDQTDDTFTIVCLKCNRKSCKFTFTDDGDIMIKCHSCGATKSVDRIIGAHIQGCLGVRENKND